MRVHPNDTNYIFTSPTLLRLDASNSLLTAQTGLPRAEVANLSQLQCLSVPKSGIGGETVDLVENIRGIFMDHSARKVDSTAGS